MHLYCSCCFYVVMCILLLVNGFRRALILGCGKMLRILALEELIANCLEICDQLFLCWAKREWCQVGWRRRMLGARASGLYICLLRTPDLSHPPMLNRLSSLFPLPSALFSSPKAGRSLVGFLLILLPAPSSPVHPLPWNLPGQCLLLPPPVQLHCSH